MNLVNKPVNGKGKIMKKILVSLLFLCSNVYAQSAYLPIECGNLKQLSETLVEYKEVPFATAETSRNIRGTVKEHVVLFFLNFNTGTWTVAEKVSDDLYCITSAGKNFNLIEKNKI